MSSLVLENLRSTYFRANPNYELIIFDRLSSEEQAMLRNLQDNTDPYGILRPRTDARLGLKAICQETVRLYLALQTPGPLPSDMAERLDERYLSDIAQLVLDGVLEIAHDNNFVSSSAAYTLLYSSAPVLAGSGKIAQLSLEALQYAHDLDIDDPIRLSARLYFYNTCPNTPYWKQRFANAEAIANELGLNPGAACLNQIDKHWMRLSPKPPHDDWLIWQLRHFTPSPNPAGQSSQYKLYISPTCEALPDAFALITEILHQSGAHSFKVGGKAAATLLRPDKLIVYFQEFEALEATVGQLKNRLTGCPAQGVPFTAAFGEDGLLSWGIDPPFAANRSSNERQSWRLWVTQRLAAALMAAKAVPSPHISPWQFALERLGMEGVDTQTWTPARGIWNTNDLT